VQPGRLGGGRAARTERGPPPSTCVSGAPSPATHPPPSAVPRCGPASRSLLASRTRARPSEGRIVRRPAEPRAAGTGTDRPQTWCDIDANHRVGRVSFVKPDQPQDRVASGSVRVSSQPPSGPLRCDPLALDFHSDVFDRLTGLEAVDNLQGPGLDPSSIHWPTVPHERSADLRTLIRTRIRSRPPRPRRLLSKAPGWPGA